MVRKIIIKRRDPIARDLLTNGLYKQKIIQSKKIYNRKKMKSGKEIMKELSHLSILSNLYRNSSHKN